jgi:hypothetical protein
VHSNDTLVPEYFGFSKGIFTENAAFKSADNALKSFNKTFHVDGII